MVKFYEERRVILKVVVEQYVERVVVLVVVVRCSKLKCVRIAVNFHVPRDSTKNRRRFISCYYYRCPRRRRRRRRKINAYFTWNGLRMKTIIASSWKNFYFEFKKKIYVYKKYNYRGVDCVSSTRLILFSFNFAKWRRKMSSIGSQLIVRVQTSDFD